MKANADQSRYPESKPGSKPEAQKRLTQYGPNEIEEKKTSTFLKFPSYFWEPIQWMIESAGILSAAESLQDEESTYV